MSELLCNRTTFPEPKMFFFLLLLVHYSDMSRSILSLFDLYFIAHGKSIDSRLFPLAFEGYWHPLFAHGSWKQEHSALPFIVLPSCCVFVSVYCARVRGREKRKTHSHLHSAVWYLLSPLLTAAHKKFTESPSFCFHQRFTLSSYYANEITAL